VRKEQNVEALWQDLKFGLRMLGKKPGFTGLIVLTLALGIGANTTIFTWVNAFFLKGFPGVPDQEELVVFGSTSVREGRNIGLSYPDFEDYRDRNQVLAGLTINEIVTMNLGMDDHAERVWGLLVSSDYFDVLHVRPAIGRGFLPEEDRVPNTHAVAVISHSLWQRRFAGDPSIVGRTITLNNTPFTVVGITPENFRGSYVGLTFDVYIPIMMEERFVAGQGRLTRRGSHWLTALARLKPGVSRRQAQASLNVLEDQLTKEYGEEHEHNIVTLYPLWRAPYGPTQVLGPVLLVLVGVVAVVLLIACANVANLLLARATARRREIAIRLSLGAGRARLIRQLLTESALLSLLGGAGGLLLGLWSWDVMLAFLPSLDYPMLIDQTPDRNILGFTLALSVLTGLIFGLAPALEASRRDMVTSLKDETGAATGGSRKARLHSLLVVAQVMLSLVLLVSAGLLVRSLQQAYRLDPGFNPRGVVLASLNLFPSGYDSERGRVFLEQLVERVGALPGVESVSLGRRIPLTFGGGSSTTLEVEGYQPARDQIVFAFYNQVGPHYFRTMQIPLLGGRDFTAQDDPTHPKVVIVSRAMAQQYWAGESPVGKRIRIGPDWLTVIGVAADIKDLSLDEVPRPHIYLPVLQFYHPRTALHVRTQGDPAELVPLLREQVHALDPTLALYNIDTLENQIRAATMPQRLGGSLLAAFGFLALILAAVGIYGVMAFAVAQRTREVGIRMALGAQKDDVVRMFVLEGARLAAIGLAAGLVVSFFVTGLLRGVLLGVQAKDPAIFGMVAVLLAGVALLACYVPARRAARVDPMVALRYE